MKRLLREPLLHFVLLGALLFGAYSYIAKRSQEEQPNEIVITQQRMENLATLFQLNWRRAPTPEELKGFAENYAREEMFFREGLRLGLDRDDPVIRNRVLQKLQYMIESSASQEPTEAQLRTYFEQHRSEFKGEPRYSLVQIFIDPKRSGADIKARADAWLGQLSKAPFPQTGGVAGDPSSLPKELDDASNIDIIKAFGAQFAGEITALTPGAWHGPIGSRSGLHLVAVTKRTEGPAPAFAEVHDNVARAWVRDQQRQASERFFMSMEKRYTVKFEPAPSSSSTGASR